MESANAFQLETPHIARVPVLELVKPVEKREGRESRELVVSAMNRVHTFWDSFYDTHKDSLTLDQKKDFALFNMGFLRTKGGEKRSFGMLKGKVMQGPMVSGAINFAKEQLAQIEDPAKQQELQDAVRVLENNSQPFFRNRNREGQRKELGVALGRDLARAIEGSDEHQAQYVDTAREMLETQMELVIPTDAPPSRRATRNTILPELSLVNTLDELSRRVAESARRFGRNRGRQPLLPVRVSAEPPVSGKFVDLQRWKENRTIAATAAIGQEVEKQLDKAETEKVGTGTEALLVRGALSDSPNVVRFGSTPRIPVERSESITAMNDDIAKMKAQVGEMQSTVASVNAVEPEEVTTDEVDPTDPLALAELAGNHPEQFAEDGLREDSGGTGYNTSENSGQDGTSVQIDKPIVEDLAIDGSIVRPENENVSAEGESIVSVDPVNVPVDESQSSAEAPVDTAQYLAHHDPDSATDASPVPPLIPPAKLPFWKRFLGLS